MAEETTTNFTQFISSNEDAIHRFEDSDLMFQSSSFLLDNSEDDGLLSSPAANAVTSSLNRTRILAGRKSDQSNSSGDNSFWNVESLGPSL